MHWQDRVNELILPFGGQRVAVAFHELRSGERFLINAETRFHAASTMKTCVLAELFHQAREDKLNLDDEIEIQNRFESIADGSFFSTRQDQDGDSSLYERVGQKSKLIELAIPMITRSSNLATNLLVEVLGADRVNGYMKDLGIHGLLVRRGVEDLAAFHKDLNNEVTASGLMELYLKLAEGKVVSSDASREMIDILFQQTHTSLLPAKLPKEAKVAHKPGWNENACHDAGIVFRDGKAAYILVVLTDGLGDHAAATDLIAELSLQVWLGN